MPTGRPIETSAPAAVCDVTPDVDVPSTPDADVDSPIPAKMIEAFIFNECMRAATERDHERTDALIEIGAVLSMARAEIVELRVELMMLALRGYIGDDAERFASEYVFPAIEAAENAAEESR
jgi:hypothetical protein